MKRMSEVKKFGEIKGMNIGKYPEAKRIDEILNKPIVISNVDIDVTNRSGKNGDPLKILYLMTDKGTFRTSATVLMKDAENIIRPAIESGNQVSVVIKKQTFKSGYRGYVFSDVES